MHPILLSLPTGAAFIQKNLRTTLRGHLARVGLRVGGGGRGGERGRRGGAVRHTLFFLSKTSRPVDTQMRAPLCHKEYKHKTVHKSVTTAWTPTLHRFA